MNDADLERYRQHLLALREDLASIRASSEDARATVQLDQQSVGRLSRMDAIQGQQMAQASERRRVVERQRIDAALERIAAGDFGDCFLCGEPIDPRRLAIDPAATRCVACVDR